MCWNPEERGKASEEAGSQLIQKVEMNEKRMSICHLKFTLFITYLNESSDALKQSSCDSII